MGFRIFPAQSAHELQTMRYALEILTHESPFDDELAIDPDRLPAFDRNGRRAERNFAYTPDPLLRSWRSARQLMAATRPGDVVLASDRLGLLGVFSLMQFSIPSSERRFVWSLAADSLFLELRVVASAHTGLSDPFEHVVDWELVQYRYSERVLATSTRAQLELSIVGVDAELLTASDQEVSQPVTRAMDHWWVPDAVSRRAQSGEVLRALATTRNSRATLNTEDAADRIWEGSTWDALAHARAILGDRVLRRAQPDPSCDVIVVGDPFSPPDRDMRSLVSDGLPVVVPAGSVAAQVWPGAPKWKTADDLECLLAGNPPQPAPRLRVEPGASTRNPLSSTATRISVAIPVFRDVRFLDECIESLLGQTLQPAEIIIVDDGSISDEVDEALEGWAMKDERIRPTATPHRGVCVARNKALEMMAGDAFVFVDSDDRLEPGFLAKCAEMLRSDDSLWAVATWTRFFGGYEGVEAKPPFDRRVGLRENPIVSTTVLVDMAVRDKGIRFEPDLAFLYCEDWHFWAQIVAAGGSVGLVPEALAHHRVHPSSGGHMRTELALAIGKARATQPLRG